MPVEQFTVWTNDHLFNQLPIDKPLGCFYYFATTAIVQQTMCICYMYLCGSVRLYL